MADMELYKDGFCISTAMDKLDLKAVHHFLSTEAYWCLNIPFEKVRKAAENSLNFGLYRVEPGPGHGGSGRVDEDDGLRQIGYARVISDRCTIAYLGDVYVLPEFRGRGLSKWLIGTVMQHPELQGLRRWVLLTGDAHGLYKQFGWKEIASPERWMEVAIIGPPYPVDR